LSAVKKGRNYTEGKIYNPVGNLAERAKKTIAMHSSTNHEHQVKIVPVNSEIFR